MSSRKKTKGAARPSTTGDTPFDSAADASGGTTAIIVRPAYIDGAPVTVDGEFINEGSPKMTPQMELERWPEAQEREASEFQQSGSQEGAEQGKNWGDPYKSIFSCPEVGFELGENRRFKQRVFRFSEKPSPEIMAALREHGFVYRPSEKAWTVTATPQSRKLTDALARTWAGPNYIQGVER